MSTYCVQYMHPTDSHSLPSRRALRPPSWMERNVRFRGWQSLHRVTGLTRTKAELTAPALWLRACLLNQTPVSSRSLFAQPPRPSISSEPSNDRAVIPGLMVGRDAQAAEWVCPGLDACRVPAFVGITIVGAASSPNGCWGLCICSLADSLQEL